MDVNDILESGLLELYILDELSATERATVESWTLQHSEVKAELTAIEVGLENLAISQALPIRAMVKDAVISKIENEKVIQDKYSKPKQKADGFPEPQAANESNAFSNIKAELPAENTELINRTTITQRRPINLLSWFAAAVLAVSSFYFYTELQKERSKSQSCEIEQRQNAKTYVETDRALNVLRNANTKTVELKGLKIAPESKVNIYWNAQKAETMLAIVNLPAPPEKMQYQLWAIVDKKPVSAGVLEYSTEALQFMKGFDKAEAFAITLEKQGGSDAPTLDKMYVLGTL